MGKKGRPSRRKTAFEEFDAATWDKQIEEDVKSGSLTPLQSKLFLISKKEDSRSYESLYQIKLSVLNNASSLGTPILHIAPKCF